jgi:hypothetical protein
MLHLGERTQHFRLRHSIVDVWKFWRSAVKRTHNAFDQDSVLITASILDLREGRIVTKFQKIHKFICSVGNNNKINRAK